MPNKTRTAIFAHFDKDNVIDDYVVYYLNALKNVTQKIVFVSACDLSAEETDKLEGITDEIICEKHDEYDFGSYKRGFLFALTNNLLNDTEELIFANDSCYGPFYPLEKVFENMSEKECDFWGITQNNTGIKKILWKYFSTPKKHLQSYFLVFKKTIFSSNDFVNFINSIKRQKKKNDVIIKYEIGLCEFLVKTGFKPAKFINFDAKKDNATLIQWKELILKHNMPFLKCSVPRQTNGEDWKNVVEKVCDYPTEIILQHINKLQNTDKKPLDS